MKVLPYVILGIVVVASGCGSKPEPAADGESAASTATHSVCAGQVDSEGNCSTGWQFVDDHQEIANWWFPRCSGGGGDFTGLDASGQEDFFIASAIFNGGGHQALGHAFDNGGGAPVHRWGAGFV